MVLSERPYRTSSDRNQRIGRWFLSNCIVDLGPCRLQGSQPIAGVPRETVQLSVHSQPAGVAPSMTVITFKVERFCQAIEAFASLGWCAAPPALRPPASAGAPRRPHPGRLHWGNRGGRRSRGQSRRQLRPGRAACTRCPRTPAARAVCRR